MPCPPNPTLWQHLAWAYANLTMAEVAVHDRAARYGPKHYMIRARNYREMEQGRLKPGSVVLDQRIRQKLPQQCVYCGSKETTPALDHVVATSAGGADSGDNIVLACRSCNSSKCSRDLFHWWSTTRPGLPPLFVIRIYIKQAIAYAQANGLNDVPLDQVHGHPFRFDLLPVEYPAPNELIFSPFHEEKWAVEG